MKITECLVLNLRCRGNSINCIIRARIRHVVF